ADRRAEVPPVLLRRPFLLALGALAPDAAVERPGAAQEFLVRLVELQRVVAQLLAAEHGQRLEDQLAQIDVVQPVVEIEAVTLALQAGREFRPLVDQLADLGHVGWPGRWRRLHSPRSACRRK